MPLERIVEVNQGRMPAPLHRSHVHVEQISRLGLRQALVEQ